jgi:hypothetical protein
LKDDKLGLGSMQLLMLAALNGSTQKNHIAARNVADTGRLIPGTQDFSRLLIKLLMKQAFWV